MPTRGIEGSTLRNAVDIEVPTKSHDPFRAGSRQYDSQPPEALDRPPNSQDVCERFKQALIARKVDGAARDGMKILENYYSNYNHDAYTIAHFNWQNEILDIDKRFSDSEFYKRVQGRLRELSDQASGLPQPLQRPESSSQAQRRRSGQRPTGVEGLHNLLTDPAHVQAGQEYTRRSTSQVPDRRREGQRRPRRPEKPERPEESKDPFEPYRATQPFDPVMLATEAVGPYQATRPVLLEQAHNSLDGRFDNAWGRREFRRPNNQATEEVTSSDPEFIEEKQERVGRYLEEQSNIRELRGADFAGWARRRDALDFERQRDVLDQEELVFARYLDGR